jgi:hypothetical protein
MVHYIPILLLIGYELNVKHFIIYSLITAITSMTTLPSFISDVNRNGRILDKIMDEFDKENDRVRYGRMIMDNESGGI